MELDKNENYINQIYDLTNSKLGNDWIPKEKIISYMEENKIITYIENNLILGYIYFYYTTEKEFINKNKLDIIITSNKKIAVLKTIVSGYSGKGIGTKLMEKFLKHIENTNIDTVYTPVWQSINGANFKKLAEKFNFVNIATLLNYWYEDSLNKPNYCPVCNTPCVCTNLIYKLTITKKITKNSL